MQAQQIILTGFAVSCLLITIIMAKGFKPALIRSYLAGKIERTPESRAQTDAMNANRFALNIRRNRERRRFLHTLKITDIIQKPESRLTDNSAAVLSSTSTKLLSAQIKLLRCIFF